MLHVTAVELVREVKQYNLLVLVAVQRSPVSNSALIAAEAPGAALATCIFGFSLMVKAILIKKLYLSAMLLTVMVLNRLC